MRLFKLYCFISLMLTVLTFADQRRIYETNRDYNQGDWITYTTTRFIRHLSLGTSFVYFATTGGITRYDYFANEWKYPWTVSNGLASNQVYLVAEDANTGFIWAVTEKGISRYEPGPQIWYNTFFDEMTSMQAPVQSIGFDGLNVYLIDADDAWYRSHNQFFQFKEISPRSGESITWFGRRRPRSKLPHFFMAQDYSQYIFDEVNREIRDNEMRHWPITNWVRDKWGTLWLATWGLGAGRADVHMQRVQLMEFGLWDKTVDDMAADDSSMWMGGIQDHDNHSGLTRWYGLQTAPTFYEPYLITGFANPDVTSIALNDRFVFWGTLGGLTVHDRQRGYWRTLRRVHHLSDDQVNDVTLDDQNAWIATDGGVSRLELASLLPDSSHIEHVLPPRYKELLVYDIESQADSLWMATELGLYVYNKQRQNGTFIGDIDFLNTKVYAISAHRSEVWFATERGAGCLLTDTHELKRIPQRLHPLDARVYRILASEQAIWYATDDGVFKYNRFTRRWRHYTRYDGLADNRVYSIHLKGDYIWFGTHAGVTRFYWNSPMRTD